MGVLIQASQFILSLSILIILHEFGHFLPAKLFKTRVEKFYLFFNPWFSLAKKRIGETIYGIGWLPLGGYVKISGMIDESMDKEQMKEPPKPYEFRAKPAWQRLIIMVGGVTVNVILGILIFAMVLYTWGEEFLPPENLKYGIAVDSIGEEIGLRDGDKVVALDNVELERFGKLTYNLVMTEAGSIQVIRDGEMKNIEVPKGTIGKITKERVRTIASPRFPIEILKVKDGSAAEKAGLQPDDKVISIAGIPVEYYHEFDRIKRQHKEETVPIEVLRNGDTVSLQTEIDENGLLGFFPRPPSEYLDTDTIHYSLLQSFPAGVREARSTFVEYVRQIALIFTSEEINAAESVGGFISIGSIFSPQWDWYRFWNMTAWLSIILAFMNLLPIPALDGGHVMFLLWEILTGRQPNQKVLEYAQIVGMVLLFGLLILANGNDVLRLIR